MAIDYGLVLSAGFGTRMGSIGKILPKILWPVFEKTLLELQIKHLESYGCRKIYVNSHFLHEKIAAKIPLVFQRRAELIHESELLGSGGAVHNIARLNNYEGILLSANGDQFIFPDSQTVLTALQKTNAYSAVLFSVEVSGGYNELMVRNNLLTGTGLPPLKKKYATYSGTGLINLSRLKKYSGYSNFFESVIDLRQGPSIVMSGGEYWDFGTSQRYFHSLFKLLALSNERKRSAFLEFCLEEKAFFREKTTSSANSYNNPSANTINLSAFPVENPKKDKIVVLETNKPLKALEGGIYYRDKKITF